MSKTISLFSGYSQKENRTTNYCLLILKLLYEENPKHLSEVLGELFGDEVGEVVGVQFRQQEKRTRSVPDGLICQQSFTIYIETKNYDWFYDKQIIRHLKELNQEAPGLKILLALGNFEKQDENRFKTVEELCKTKFHDTILFASATFEELLDALKNRDLPKNLADAVTDFGAYLDEEHLLPSWQYRLDVVNCASLVEEPLDQAYLCPARGGAYNHKRSRFFGIYKKKRVSHVACIEAVIDLIDETDSKLLWKNVERTDADLCKEARSKLARWRAGRYPTRVFLLGPLAETNFVKDTSRGMQGSKTYFKVTAEDAEQLAEMLRDRCWSDWRESV